MISLNTIEEALEDLRQGRMVIVVDDENRENEGDFILPASQASAETVHFMAKNGRGLICQAITEGRARQLELPLMEPRSSDPRETAFTVSVDARRGTTTGISAADRALTARRLIDSEAAPGDFSRPGHLFPLIARPGGVLERPGHTEAAVDLAQEAGLPPSGLICEIMDDDGTMARLPRLRELADEWNLQLISIRDLIDYRRRNELKPFRIKETAKLPTRFGVFTMIGYENAEEAFVLLKESPQAEFEALPPLVRIHSECLTGEALGSLRCDCGDQLKKALIRIEEEGYGAVVYLRQEGRGIGLLNKIRAYHLQDGGVDTWDANTALGLPPDARNYRIAAELLRDVGIGECRLMTNNPDKIAGLEEQGIIVRRVIHESAVHPGNRYYLTTKKNRFGHLLEQV